MEEKIIIPNACFDNPTKQDYIWNPPEELNGINSKRPKDKVTVQDQKQTPACTFYSAYHVINGYNILEDERQGVNRPQIDPLIPRNIFCKERGYSNKGYDIQWAAQKAKDAGKIQGWGSIPASLPNQDQVDRMKRTLDAGYFMNCWSSNGDWHTTGVTGVYTLRTDGKFVGHAWSIIDYDNSKGFLCINSRWIWGQEKGYFWLPFNLVDKVYSKLAIIDKDDSWYFAKLKERSQAMDAVRALKKTYALTIPQADKDMCAKLATELRTIYGFTDKDL